ncbi:ImmA/IrrE family metallo-endopeptidase [Posidoniimonas corsicana]|uniref:ImmA/IrrE family metallo-endopeptidase n=1 Tax=Posidoniimonas corsicana TaxID=1938618 RepID=UPI0011B5421E|nr:ImmA/IrrE family metallo-endopeptidase [Posidoniimonas corsicana]
MAHAARERATLEGEAVAEALGCDTPPIDPFDVVRRERRLIHAEGDDFGDAFDGRIRYLGRRFLIAYNTCYDRWPHQGKHHSKVLFTVAHELGHFYLPEHRRRLVTSRRAHDSFTEFVADRQIEQEADAFAAGLLMPKQLLRRFVNAENFPTIERIKEVRNLFSVSLTGLLVRWTQLSDFPCLTVAARGDEILFGWASESLRSQGVWGVRRGERAVGKEFQSFVRHSQTGGGYRESKANGALYSWAEHEGRRLLTQEHYFYIPHTGMSWCLVMADEQDFERQSY